MLRQLPNSSPVFKNYHFYINEEVEECDYWFVYNYLNNKSENVFCPEENLILIAPEPEHVQKYHTSYLAQFNTVISNQKNINHNNNIIYQTGAPWFVKKTYDELSTIESLPKDKAISIITSNKAFTKSHKLRLDFALKLKSHFKDKIDLYGRGINDFDDKWEVLKNYKYTIAIENGAYDDYFTEKITDSFLSFTFPLYYGCKNISQYFSEESFKYIDIENFEKSKSIIEEVLDSPFHYDDKIAIIKESRIKCLNEYNIFQLMINFIENRICTSETKKEIKIYNSFNDIRTFKEKIENKITNFLVWK